MFRYVSSTPDIQIFKRSVSDRFIIIGSDGLWDMISSQEAVELVESILQESVDTSTRRATTTKKQDQDSENNTHDQDLIQTTRNRRKTIMADYLVHEALKRGSDDNTTAIVLWF